MKKLSTLLVLLLTMLVGGVNCAYAEGGDWTGKCITTVSEPVTNVSSLQSGYYLLRNVGRETFLRENADHGLYLWNATNGAADVASVSAAFVKKSSVMSSVVYITKKADGSTFTMQFKSGYYLGAEYGAVDGEPAIAKETPGDIEMADIVDGQIAFRPSGKSYANGNGVPGHPHTEGTFTGWESKMPGADGNGAYQFYPVELAPSVDCTFTITDGENTIATYQSTLLAGSEVTIPSALEFSYYYNPTITTENKTVSSENCNFTIQVTVGEMPFKPSTWYTVKFRNKNDRYLMHANKGDEKIDARRQMTADYILNTAALNNKIEAFNGALWAFVPDGFGVKLLCKQNGKYVTSNCRMDATGATFIVKTNSTGGFSLQVPGNSIAHLGEHDGGKLGVWNDGRSQNDGGSNFQIAEASLDEVFKVGKAVYSSVINGLTATEADATMLTACTEAALNWAKEKCNNATKIEDLDAAFAHATYAYPEEGSWYRIKNVNSATKKYISSESISVGKDGNLNTSVDRTVRRALENDKLVSQLWTMKKNEDGTYRVVNANTNRALSAYTGNNVDMPINEGAGGRYFFRTVPNAFSGITGTDLELMAYGYTDPQVAYRINAFQGDANNVIRDYGGNYDGDKGNYWKFIEVTEIPVTVSAAGWASLALPFEVTIPAESGVVAYTAQRVDADMLVLSEITDGVIPANEGVILGKEGGAEVTLAITHTGKAKIEGNKLMGATAKRIGFAAESTYALALDEAGNAAFLRNGLECIPANKAYLLAEEVPSLTTTKLSFNFGTVNGINDAVAEDTQAETYYDLNGRVALYPHNGIFVTKSGKKVFIK